jgi:HAD superfamily hydrolase (TIGR01459 family)
MTELSTLPDLAARYDAFLVDQFGVLLDGTGAYPAAPAALSALAATGKPVLMLSNSGKRADPNAARLARLGFDVGATRGVLSSGEAAFRRLEDDIAQGRIAPGTPVWLHARDGDTSAVAGLDLTPVAHPDAAGLVILAGSQGDSLPLDWYRDALGGAAARGVPAFCTNPDLEMLTPTGTAFGAGAIAALYAEMGGPVTWIGKPHRPIYDIALDILGRPYPARVLCIGDSPAHDVAGGRGAGLATALVTRTGLHAGLDLDALRALCAAEGAVPDHVIPAFDWTGETRCG